MPFRKKRTFKKKRRFTKRRGKRSGRRKPSLYGLTKNKTIIYHDKSATPSGLPNAYYCTLNFHRVYEVDETALSTVRTYSPSILDKVFNATSQPVHEWDQFNALYNRYVVLAFDWKIKFLNYTSADPLNVVIVAWPQSDSPSSVNDAMNREGAQSRLLQQSGGGSAAFMTMSGHVNCAKIIGVKNLVTEWEFWGNKSSSPQIYPRFYIYVKNAAAVVAVRYVADLQFKIYTKFFDRENIPESMDSGLERRVFKQHWKSVMHDRALAEEKKKRKAALVERGCGSLDSVEEKLEDEMEMCVI